jgi:hypothetical protein
MKHHCEVMRIVLTTLIVALAALAPAVAVAQEQQLSDPGFDPAVARPAYQPGSGPQMLFDEAHFNFHTAGGRYRAFADLLRQDGYRISPNRERFTLGTLRRYDLLVIANALGAADLESPAADAPAFTADEATAVDEWVRAGGALLLITDHQPTGGAAQILADRFGVQMSDALVVDKTAGHHLDGYMEFNLEFTRANGLLAAHAITAGRDSTERVGRVVAFGGQSLRGPPESNCFLALGPAAFDFHVASSERTSAAGRCMGLALRHGRGRVVIMGEAGMLSAQRVEEDGPSGKTSHPWGMNWPGLDNRQLALNICHWLTGALR